MNRHGSPVDPFTSRTSENVRVAVMAGPLSARGGRVQTAFPRADLVIRPPSVSLGGVPPERPPRRPTMRCPLRPAFLLSLAFSLLPLAARADDKPAIQVRETDEYVQIDTDALQARIRKKDYVSGVERRTFLDKKTGAREVGYGLHIMDFLMAP